MKHAPLILAGAMAACSPGGDAAGADPVRPPAAPSAQAPEARPAGPQLAFPVACTIGRTCEVQNYVDHDAGPGAKDFRCGSNTYDGHGGVDIRILDMGAQRAGVAVLAAAPGRVARLRDGVADVSVKSPGAAALNGQECGNGVVIDHGEGWETQYCHLAKGSLKVAVGDQVAAGQPLASIGLSGNTEYPHVHVTVRHNGTMIDPFSPGSAAGACDAGAGGRGMWTAAAAQAMSYKPGAVLNAGFADAPVSMEAIEAGGIKPPSSTSPMLIAYVRAINLHGGDVQELTIIGPDGRQVATGAQPPLDRAKAQYMAFVGKRAGAAPWPAGEYQANYVVRRNGETVLRQRFSTRLGD
ncbi:M23 family metallopeptidase [Phenylobacterium sp.]|uniref:M23 family metallopeptidase n=1 Tax=Phenylobacterium sp. TaxID=1871053 RepID=UPI0028A0345E|nr:M23 family metallopeptidase [Phenylobacterium sp.]